MLRKNTQFGLQRDIFFAIEFDAFPHGADISEIFILVEFGSKGIVHQFAVEAVGIRLNMRLDLNHKISERVLQGFVLCIAGHSDMTPGNIFANNGFEFAHVLQPFFH